MNILSYSLKMISISAIFFIHSQLHPMVLAVACLKRLIGGKSNKIVLLHQQHVLDHYSPVKKGHIEDMHNVINIAAKKPYEVPFLVGISEADKDPQRLKNVVQSPAQVAIKTALDNNMKLGNIDFMSFDTRSRLDFWIRDMLLQRYEFMKAIQEGYEFPSDFYDITAESALELFGNRYTANIPVIKSLPLCKETQATYFTLNEQLHKVARDCLLRLLKSHNVDCRREHLFNLIGKLEQDEVNQLGFATLEENCFGVDMNLLQQSLMLSKKYPLSIISAGVYHGSNTEKRLLTHFPDFKKDMSSSISFSNLHMDSLSNIRSCKNIPDHFMTKNLESFIAE